MKNEWISVVKKEREKSQRKQFNGIRNKNRTNVNEKRTSH